MFDCNSYYSEDVKCSCVETLFFIRFKGTSPKGGREMWKDGGHDPKITKGRTRKSRCPSSSRGGQDIRLSNLPKPKLSGTN